MAAFIYNHTNYAELFTKKKNATNINCTFMQVLNVIQNRSLFQNSVSNSPPLFGLWTRDKKKTQCSSTGRTHDTRAHCVNFLLVVIVT